VRPHSDLTRTATWDICQSEESVSERVMKDKVYSFFTQVMMNQPIVGGFSAVSWQKYASLLQPKQ